MSTPADSASAPVLSAFAPYPDRAAAIGELHARPAMPVAAPATLYHLAAAEGAEIEQTLDDSVILITAIFNPDGHSRRINHVETFGGEVPRTMEELLTLRGVARKTANVVLSTAYGIHMGVVVDTHVARLAVRLGLVDEGTTVPQIERRLMAMFPRDRWGDLSHMLIWHGRRACKARGAACSEHPICKKFGSCCELRDPA